MSGFRVGPLITTKPDRPCFILGVVPMDFEMEMTHAKMLVELVEHGPLHQQDLGDALTREALIRHGLASKIVFDGEQNFIAATYLGSSVYCKKIVGEDHLHLAVQKRRQQGEITQFAR
jgi:hypothetical protein